MRLINTIALGNNKTSLFAIGLALSAAWFTPFAHAEDKMKPGLWEMTVHNDMLKKMPTLPPAQLAEMKKRGITMPEMKNGAAIQKVCITKEMAERQTKYASQSNPAGCKESNMVKSGNAYSMELVCDSPMLKGTGTIKGSLNGDTLMSTYDFKGTSHNRPINHHTETTGKWLSADCGDIKPIVPPNLKK